MSQSFCYLSGHSAPSEKSPPRSVKHKHGKIEESEIDELAIVEAMLEFKHIDNRGVQRIGQLL